MEEAHNKLFPNPSFYLKPAVEEFILTREDGRRLRAT
jgi:hypothetical protein